MMRTSARRLSLAIACLAPLSGASLGLAASADVHSTYAIEHVNVLPMTRGGAPILNATVVIRDGRIAALGPYRSMRRPPGVQRIEAQGKWLMPGLADMHVHAPNRSFGAAAGASADLVRTDDVMLPFIANGVTQIVELGATPASLEQRAQIESGAALGPHLATAAMVDGSPPVWEGRSHVVTTPQQGREAVRQIKADGFDFVKVYSRLDPATYAAILDEGRAQGIRVLGHLPNAARGTAQAGLLPGLSLVAHAEEYAKQSPDLTDADIERFAALTRANGTWVTPTLITMVWIAKQTRAPDTVAAVPGLRYVHPLLRAQWLHDNRFAKSATPERMQRFDRIVEFNTRLARAFAATGVPMMPGTDAVIPGVVYGFSLHDELRLMVAAGLSNRQVLEAATRLPAEFLGVAGDRGTVEVGRAADLILLDADPLEDVANAQRIFAVVLGGRYLSRAELDAKMEDLAQRYRQMESALAPGQAASGGHSDD